MTLSNLSKLIIIGGTVGTFVGVGIATSKPLTTVEKILYWEKNNGGCKIHLAISYDQGKLYRPGKTKEGLTEEQLQKVLKDISENTETKAQNKESCEENKNKRLVLANKLNKWTKDGQDWNQKVPE